MASKRRSGAEVDGTAIPLADGRAANRPTQGAQNGGGNEHGLGMNISPQTGQQNGGNRSRDTAETSPGVRLQVKAVE